jgi:phosphatidylserine decarboxylase
MNARNVIKVCALIFVSIITLSFVYYAPSLSPFIKPILPIQYRWTEEEIKQQIAENRIDKSFLRYFERDPERKIPDEKKIIVAAADGVVKRIRNIEAGKRIVIYMSFWDVHIQRVPLSGKTIDVERSYHMDEADFKCEQCAQSVTRIQTEIGLITVKQVTSAFAKQINTYLRPNQTVATGERLGFIFTGSHTVVEFPDRVNLTVKEGDRVIAGETIIARY